MRVKVGEGEIGPVALKRLLGLPLDKDEHLPRRDVAGHAPANPTGVVTSWGVGLPLDRWAGFGWHSWTLAQTTIDQVEIENPEHREGDRNVGVVDEVLDRLLADLDHDPISLRGAVICRPADPLRARRRGAPILGPPVRAVDAGQTATGGMASCRYWTSRRHIPFES